MVRATPSGLRFWLTVDQWTKDTPHQSLAYVRHITLPPAANLSTASAIVFVSIKAIILHYLRWYINGNTIFLTVFSTRMAQMTKDFARHHDEIMWTKAVFRLESYLWQIVHIKLYIPSMTSVAPYFCYDFTGVLPVDCAIKSGPRAKSLGCGTLTQFFYWSFLHDITSCTIIIEWNVLLVEKISLMTSSTGHGSLINGM